MAHEGFEAGDTVEIRGTVVEVEEESVSVISRFGRDFTVDKRNVQVVDRQRKEPTVGSIWLNGGKPDRWVYVGDDKFYSHRYGQLYPAVDFYKHPEDWAEAK